MKLCIDCKWFDNYTCKAPQNMVVDPVDGSAVVREFKACASHRKGVLTGQIECMIFGLCGTHGRWFVAKESKA